METLDPLCLELIAEHLLNSYGLSDPMIAVARDAGSCARVSRWFRDSLALPLYESIDPGCVRKHDTHRSDLGCPVRQLARAFIVTDAKEPGATVTATEALVMGLAPRRLERLNYELEMGPPDELEEPFDDDDDAWITAARNWGPNYSPNWTPVRKYRKRDVLEMLMTTTS